MNEITFRLSIGKNREDFHADYASEERRRDVIIRLPHLNDAV